MAGPMAEVLSVTGLVDHLARRLVDLPALQYLSRLEGLSDASDRRVTTRCDYLENLRVLGRDIAADESGPSQVAVDRPGPIELGPEIDEDEVALVNHAI